MRCSETIEMRKAFIEKLLMEMLKNREDVEVDLIMLFCEDMLRCLENETEEEYETNQRCVSMKKLFRRHEVIDRLEANFRCEKHKELNKILVK